jgi:hypothetical protein
MGVKLTIRIIFWIFIGFILLKGIVSFAQGTRIIEKVTNIGSTKPEISDSIKGFATDFATEYFTWTINNVNDRPDRLSKFTQGIDLDAGLKSYDVKGSSRVLSVDVYSTNKIDANHYDITTVVRREVQLLPLPGASLTSTPAPASSSLSEVMKTYMVVPVTMTGKGPLIESYPRFVAEQQKGEPENISIGQSVTDTTTMSRGLELADSFLRSYFDGNVNQLKYFYDENVKPPETITKFAFKLDKVDKVTIYKVTGSNGLPDYLRIEASVIVKSDIEESFVNMWILNATEKNGKLYVISIGHPSITDSSSSSSLPSSSTVPASAIPTTTNQ